MTTIKELISREEKRLLDTRTPNELANILYNLIHLQNKVNNARENYKNTKLFIDYYLEYIKSADFGYDSFNYVKINNLLKFMKPEEQIAILQYSVSVVCRELPEHDREWFIIRKHKAEIEEIVKKRKFLLFPKAFLLYCGQSTKRLVITLILFIFFVNVLLLPTPYASLALFAIKYESYSTNFIFNHFLNVISLFSDLENNFKISPLNWFSLLLIIAGKIMFVILLVNFIYIKLSDKIITK